MSFAELIVPSLTKTKSYLTGGFRTVSSMVEALNVIDGVGLARPLCQEPYLCSHILAGKVYSSVALQLSQYDFLSTAMASMLQMRQIGNNQQPINLGLGDNTALFYQTVQEYMAEKKEDTKGEIFGPPVIQGYNEPLGSHLT